jgi:hypothetical protein
VSDTRSAGPPIDHLLEIFQAAGSVCTPELASSIKEKVEVLADQCDGKPLPEADGVLRIGVPEEKMRSRWMRQVSELEIVSVLSHKAR